VVTRDTQSLDLDISDVMGLVEDANLDVNGFAGHYGLKKELRGLRDANGNQLAVMGMKENSLYENPLTFVRNGAFDKTKAELIGADWSKSIVGIREGIEFEILKEATLQSVTMADGKPLSLAENDMIAIKATMRLAYLPIKDEAFAVLKPKAAVRATKASK
ncbi:MAG: phage major capsid protein, partial [Paraclostridium sp.]